MPTDKIEFYQTPEMPKYQKSDPYDKAHRLDVQDWSVGEVNYDDIPRNEAVRNHKLICASAKMADALKLFVRYEEAMEEDNGVAGMLAYAELKEAVYKALRATGLVKPKKPIKPTTKGTRVGDPLTAKTPPGSQVKAVTQDGEEVVMTVVKFERGACVLRMESDAQFLELESNWPNNTVTKVAAKGAGENG